MSVMVPDPVGAENTVNRYREVHGRISKKRKELLYLLSSYSSFLGRSVIRDPGILDSLLDSRYVDQPKSEGVSLEETCGILGASETSRDGFLSELRRYKYRELARIVYRDIVGAGPFESIMAELSSLSSAVLEAALRFFLRELGIDGGEKFVVMGMGKLGGRELNLSSDIDLVYYYDGVDDSQPYFKLAEMITKSLSALTQDGFLYRVDIGLRPGGSRSPIAMSLDSALEHYFYWGDTWERAALIKARPVAGNLSLGERFITDIEPFVYKRHLDFASIEDLKDMKAKLDGLHKKRDVKLGKGGIREVEFFVQALQLVNGGALAELRNSKTLATLESLKRFGIITEEVSRSLRESYLFLRRVEHNIQLIDEIQTHKLPQDSQSLTRLAKMCGFETAGEFESVFSSHTSAISTSYNELFHEPSRIIEEDVREFWHLADFLAEGDVPEEQALESLANLGFQNPEGAMELIYVLLDSKKGGLTQKGRSLAKKVIPAFLRRVIGSRDPDLVLINLERFISRVGLRTSIYSMLSENPDIVSLLARLFSSSGYLSNFLINHPEYLDVIVLSGVRSEHSSKEELLGVLEAAVEMEEDYDQKLNAIRRVKNVETLKLCLRDLNREVDPAYVGSYLTMLADAIVSMGLVVAGEGMGMSRRQAERMLVLAQGKLGGEEMGYNSDLDLVFVYDEKDHMEFSKLCQRLISVLSLNTSVSFAYKIDTRLRPSGQAGALVSSYDAYKRYHEEKARLWERQALIKARPIAGSEELGERVMETIEHCVYEQPLEDDFHKEIDRLRMRMERELARETEKKLNLKTGRGGLVDIEFVVQMLQLRHGSAHPSVRTQNTLAALEAIKDCDLIDGGSYRVLKEGLYFLKSLENRLRLLHDRARDDLSYRDFSDLAIELGMEEGGNGGGERGGGGERLREMYLEKTDSIRRVYESYFS